MSLVVLMKRDDGALRRAVGLSRLDTGRVVSGFLTSVVAEVVRRTQTKQQHVRHDHDRHDERRQNCQRQRHEGIDE